MKFDDNLKNLQKMKKLYKWIGKFVLAFSIILNIFPSKVYALVNSGETMYHLENETFDEMIASGYWAVENIEKKDATVPEVVDGKIKLKTKDSLGFQWMKLLGEENYSVDYSYIFDFDIKITDSGNGFYWDYTASTRALYVGFGGYWNQIEFNNISEQVRAGETYINYDAHTYENKKMHGQVILEGTTVTSTITDEVGNMIATGSRTNDVFADMDAREKCMTYLVLRCEDGAVEIDNFNFSMKKTEIISTTPFINKGGSKVEYTASLNYKENENTLLKLGNTNIFSLENNVMKICGSTVTGTYGTGIYDVDVEINPLQQILKVEITLPDGGIVRRGYASIPAGDAFFWKSTSLENNLVASRVNNESIQYKLVELNVYELTTKEPEGDEFSQQVYNIVQSFEDAHTTRLFAWTVKASFLQNGDKMFLRYREKGEEKWNLVETKKQEEPSEVKEEDYYKVDLVNLTAGKEYEYQIGVQRVIQEDVWSNIYTFKTTIEDVSEFKFIAIGDTQGVNWEGNTRANKGYMYAMAALDQAFKEVDEASFVLHTGDVTEWGSTLTNWNHYFKALSEHAKTTPHFATVGNHDTWVNDNNNYFSFHFNHPDNGADALDQNYKDKITYPNLKVQFTESEDTIYSYDYGDAHFIVLHSGSYVDEDEYMLQAQRQWLINDLEENKDAKWKIILVHEPVYHRKGGQEDRPWLYDTIEAYGVDLVIQGHSHLVTRTYPMKDGSIATKTSVDVIKKGVGTVYTTIGSTTLNHDSLGNPNVEECMLIVSPESKQAAYTIVSIDEDSLTMTVKQLNGYVLDQFEIVAEEEKDETITDKIEIIKLNYSTINLNKDNDVNLMAKIYPVDTTSDKTLTWSSNNENVATVDANGKVTAKSEGTATITVETVNGITATCEVTVHNYTIVVTSPTCTKKGHTTYLCDCGHSYKDNYISALGHNEVVDNAVEATCTTTGLTQGKHCSRCNTVFVKQEEVKVKEHSFTNYVSDNNATYESDGTKTAKCDRCDVTNTVTDIGSKLEPLVQGVNRIAGDDRYDTAFKVADTLKTILGIKKFDTVIVADGTNFADALAGSYLSSKKNAPILMTDKKDKNINNLVNYIKSNLNDGGKVYILGGTAAVSEQVDAKLSAYDVKRLAGEDRYATNLEILKEVGITNEDLLVCTGTNFADSLSASSTSRPILLVGNKLNASQIEFLNSLNRNEIYVVGGTSAVNSMIEYSLKEYGEVSRLAGATRYQTSILVAETFFKNPTSAVVALSTNFPDGLSGGALAYQIDAPLLLTNGQKGNYTITSKYTNSVGIKNGYVLGGAGLVTDEATKEIFGKG